MLITAAVVGIPLLILVCGLLFLLDAYKRLRRPAFLLLISILFAIPYIAYKSSEKTFHLSHIPDALQIHAVAYAKEDSWGFGPGGDASGILMYPLSEHMARQISAEGMRFFSNMPANKDQNERALRGAYDDWHESPLRADRKRYWEPREGTTTLNIYDYICTYDPKCLDIKPETEAEANAIVNSAGSYYAYGRSGLIVVSPERKVVLYLYGG